MAIEPRKKSRSYAGRQVDLELLKHVEDPAVFNSLRRVNPVLTTTPRIVSGIEKAVQRYAKLFLTHIGSVKLAPDVGNDLLSEIAMGRVGSEGYLTHLVTAANADTLNALASDDEDPDTYGELPDDERIVAAEPISAETLYDNGTGGRVKVRIAITTAAGEDYTFIIPVAAGIT